MEQRFEVRKQELLAECEVQLEVFERMMERLREFAQPFVECLWRKEQKEHAQTYIAGLLSDLKRKNIESIAYRHDKERRGMQRFIGFSSWKYEPLLEELARQVGEEVGEAKGVIVFDPSGFQKKGKESVGVGRQWLGRLGKVENGQVAVYMGYTSSKEHALVDERLYLPKEWCSDKGRLKACGVPKEIRFRTRHELALEMLKDKGKLLPHRWIAGDDEMGRSTKFRRDLRSLGKQYLLAVPSNTNVRDMEGECPPWQGRGAKPKRCFERVDQWCTSIPEKAWSCIDVRDGNKGPLTMEIVKTGVVARTERSRRGVIEEVLVITRSIDENKKVKHDYYLSNAPPDTPLKEFARVVKAEHRIEECIERSKSEAGLADYEVRTWAGWHHHQTLSIIATWFLVMEARRGKKMDTSNYSSADSGWAGNVVA